MRIGVIGAGQLGGTLATWCAESGHEVAVTSRHPERLREQVDRMNWRLRVMSVPQAASFGEVVIFAPNWSSAREAVDTIRGGLDGKVVIDATNPADMVAAAAGHDDDVFGSGVFGGRVAGGGMFSGGDGVFNGGDGVFSGMAGASTKNLSGATASGDTRTMTGARGIEDAALVAAAVNGPPGEASDMLLARAGGRSNLETLIDWAPGAHWVKAFNTIPTDVLSRRRGHDPLLAEFVCTDERDARETACRLIRDVGFAPFYAGGAKAARLTETGGPLQMREVDVQDATDVLAEALCTLR